MTWSWFFNIKYFTDRSIFEPWKFLVGDEKLLLSCQKPYAMTRNIGNFNH